MVVKEVVRSEGFNAFEFVEAALILALMAVVAAFTITLFLSYLVSRAHHCQSVRPAMNRAVLVLKVAVAEAVFVFMAMMTFASIGGIIVGFALLGATQVVITALIYSLYTTPRVIHGMRQEWIDGDQQNGLGG